MKTKPIFPRFHLASTLVALLAAPPAVALDGTWLGVSGNWDASGTWSGGTIADGADFTANFTGVNITAAQTITLSAPQTIGNITFTDATTSSHNLTISGANILTLDVTSGVPAIQVTQADRVLAIASEISGTDGLATTGPGVVTLSGVNTYSGTTQISAGRLNIANLSALGATSGITIGGASAASLSSSTSGLTITAPITTANAGVNSTLAFGVNSNATGTFNLNGAISGAGNVIFTTVGTSNNNLQTVNLGVAGTYTGSTTITSSLNTNSNVVRNNSGAANVLPVTTVLSFSNIDAQGSGRSTGFDLNGQDQTLAGLSFTGTLGARRFFNVNNTGTAATLTIDNSADYSFGGATNANSTVAPNPLVQANARILGAIALTKKGPGTFSLGGTLSGGATVNPHPYTGATTILGGTLRLFSGGAITASSGITIQGSTAKLLQENTVTPIAPTVTLTEGTLTGNGTVNTVNVGNATGGVLSNNNGVAGAALTIGALTFNGGATVNTFNSSTAAAIVTSSLTTNAAGTVTVNPSAASWAAGTYDLISYGGGSIGGAGFAPFALGTVVGASPRQSLALGDSGTAITLTVGPDDVPYWVGDGDDNWNTVSTNNWKLNSNNSATTFLAADNALFNDSATGTGTITVNLNTADVTPTSTTFDNSTKDYVLNTTGAFGIATGSLTKNGTGSVTLNTLNTFTGSTTINGGSLTIGGAGQLGGGNYAATILNDGSFIYSSSAAQTLSGIISGIGSITQNGPGNLTLSGANTFLGGLIVKGGTVVLGHSSAAGTDIIDFNTAGATPATVQVSGALSSMANPITVSSGSNGINTLAHIGTGALALNGEISIASGTTLTLDNSSSNSSLDVGNGLITGDGSLIATGTSTGSFIFRGASTYSGGTTLGGAGTYVILGNSTGTGTGTTDGAFGTGTLTLANVSMRSSNLADSTIGNTLVLDGNLTTPTISSEKTLTFSGPVTLTGNRTLTSQVVASGKSLAFSGVIGDGGNSYGITKEGSGVLLLGGANTYTGPTTVNAGTLSITDSASLGTTAAATTINGGNGSNSVILSLSAATADLTITEPLNLFGNPSGRARLSNNSAQNHTLSGPLDVSSDTNLAQIFSDGSGSITISGDITGTMTNGASFFLRGTSTSSLNQVTGSINLAGNLSKTDAGTWLLGASGETYIWTDTVVAVGTLKMGVANALPSSSIIIMGNPTGGSTPTLDLNGFSQTVAGILYNGQGVATGARTITSTSPAVLTVDNPIDSVTTGNSSGTNTIALTGALGIVKQGTGTLTLNGVNSYSGDTTVNAGILSLTRAASAADANTGNLASTVTIAASGGATLDLAFTGTDEVDKLFIGATQMAAGVYGAVGSGAPIEIAQITGTGTLTVATGPASANDFAAWAALQSPPVTGGPTGDHDLDGVPNLIEYALADGQERGTLAGGSISFTKRGGIYGSDLAYTIESSEDLGVSDPWSAVTPTVDNASTISYMLPDPGDNFARLKVTQIIP